jgi:type III secretory pathway component EscT
VTGGSPLAPLAAAAIDVALHALRLLPPVALSPLLGGPLLPPAARAALALALGAAARSASGGAGGPPPDPGPIAAAAVRELAFGTALAVAASLPVEAARGAGRLVDTLRGATLGELHVAPVRQQETATGDLLVHWTLALAAWSGADRLLLSGLLGSFRALPVGAPLPDAGLLAAGVAAAGELLAAGLRIGAPAAAAVLAAEAGLAVTARIAPRAAPGDAAAPLRAALGLLAVALAAGTAGARLVEAVAIAAGLAGAIGTPGIAGTGAGPGPAGGPAGPGAAP